ncbi:MAG: hypothetical protein AMXMBFR84_08370 [Candidatus Hydrogenedentota bacterium]
MACMNRRQFMKHTGGLLAAAASVPAFAQGAAPASFQATASRTLGGTGIQCSLLGMGTGTKAWNGSSAQNRMGRQHFVTLIEHAYAQGLRYFDLADMYGAHDYMKDAMKASVKREECMLLSKSVSREPGMLRADLERFRKELDTDYVDVVLLHCMTEPDWNVKLQGCMDVLSEAKEKGQIRAHGVSCHNFGAMQTASESPWVDCMLSRINPFGVKMDGTPEEVSALLKKAHASGKGMLGMKIVGEGELNTKIPESLQYVLGLGCLDTMTVGFLERTEIDDMINRIGAVKLA